MKIVIYWNTNREVVQAHLTPENGTQKRRVLITFDKLEALGLTSDTADRVVDGAYKPKARELASVRDKRDAYLAELLNDAVNKLGLEVGDKSAGLTVGYAIDQWNEKHWPTLKEAENKKAPKGETIVLSELRTVKSLLGHVKLDELNEQHIAQALEPFHPSNGYSPSTYNALLSSLSRVLTWSASKKRRWIERNFMLSNGNKGDSLWVEKRSRHDWLSIDEYHRLLDELEKSKNPHLFDAVVLAVYTGSRKNELMNSLWSDFDEINNKLVFRYTKNKTTKQIILDDSAATILRKRMKVRAIYSNRIFPRQASWSNNSKNYDLKGTPDFLQGLKRALVRAGINCPAGCTHDHSDEPWFREHYPHRKICWHSLRHTTASIIANNGGTLEDIQHHLGQKDPQSAQIYKHLVDDHTKKTSAILDKALSR